MVIPIIGAGGDQEGAKSEDGSRRASAGDGGGAAASATTPSSAPALPSPAEASPEAELVRSLAGVPAGSADTLFAAFSKRTGDNYRSRIHAAAVAKRHGYLDEALDLLRSAASKRPDRSEPFLLIGRILASRGRTAEAQVALEAALAIDPANTKALSSLADLAVQAGDRRAAAAFLERAHAIAPRDPRFIIRLADELWAAGEFRRARPYLLLLLDTPPADERALRAGAVLLGRCGEYPGEIQLLRRALEISPGRISTQLRLVAAMRNAGQVEESVSLLLRLREWHPAVGDADRHLIEVLADRGRTEDVLALVDDVERRRENDAAVWVPILKAVDRTQPWTTVEDVIRRARMVAGRHPRLMLAEAQAYVDRGLNREGEERLQEAEAEFGDHPAVRRYRIDCDTRFGRFGRALAAIASLPGGTAEQRAVRHLYRGKLEASRLALDAAAAAFEAAVAADPFHVGALGGLARVYALRFQIGEARGCIVEANRLNRGQLLARGRSPNPSQSLLGEILNDFAADPEALAEVQEAVARPGWEGPLAAVRRFPDYTGAAISLLIRLRQCGLFADRAPGERAPEDPTPEERAPEQRAPATTGATRPIPRRIHQFWDTPALPPDVADLTASWPALNPAWHYHRYDLPAARAYLAERTTLDVQRAFRSARGTAQKADIFRLAVLLNEGGVYCDADDRCTGPLDGLVAGHALVLRQEPWGTIGNNFIAVVPGHPFIEAALSDAVTATLRGDAETVWLSTGPGVMTRAFARWLAEGGDAAGGNGQGGQPPSAAVGAAGGVEAPGPILSQVLDRAQVLVLMDASMSTHCVSGCRVSYKATGQHWARREFSLAR